MPLSAFSRWLLGGLVLALIAGLGTLSWLARRPSTTATATATAERRSSPVTTRGAGQPAIPAAPNREPDDPRIAGILTPAQADAYLLVLEQEARQRGAVLPSDFTRGRAAIARAHRGLGQEAEAVRARRFGEKLAGLQRQLETHERSRIK